jgi:hypothetical protein
MMLNIFGLPDCFGSSTHRATIAAGDQRRAAPATVQQQQPQWRSTLS